MSLRSPYLFFLSLLVCSVVTGQVKTSKKYHPYERKIGATLEAGYKRAVFGAFGITLTNINDYDIWSSFTLSTELSFTKNDPAKLKLGFWRCYNFVHIGYGASITQTLLTKNSSIALRPELGAGNETLRAYASYDLPVSGKQHGNRAGILFGISARFDFKSLR